MHFDLELILTGLSQKAASALSSDSTATVHQRNRNMVLLGALLAFLVLLTKSGRSGRNPTR